MLFPDALHPGRVADAVVVGPLPRNRFAARTLPRVMGRVLRPERVVKIREIVCNVAQRRRFCILRSFAMYRFAAALPRTRCARFFERRDVRGAARRETFRLFFRRRAVVAARDGREAERPKPGANRKPFVS